MQDKITAVITNVPSKNKEVLTALLVKSLFLSLGASKVSLTNLSPVESLSSANASLERPLHLSIRSQARNLTKED